MIAQDRGPSRTAESYEIVLPPGWKQHPVRRGVAEELYAHVRQVLEPTGNRDLMVQLRAAIHKGMRDLQERGGIDIFLPERRPGGTVVPASLTSNLIGLGDRGLETALRKITRGKDPEAVEVPVGTAYRCETPSSGSGDLAGIETSNVHYLFEVPGAASPSAVMFTFSILRSDDVPDEYREILTLIFDAMMQSLVWRYREDD